MKTGDLIVSFVRCDIGAGGKVIINNFNIISGNAILREPLEISAVVMSDGAGDYRMLP
jgi:hypothetical protein